MKTLLLIYLTGIPFSWLVFNLRWPLNAPVVNLMNAFVWPLTMLAWALATLLT